MEKEKLIEQYMKSLGISKEEALQLWEDDQNDFIGEQGEEMTKKAKEVKRYEQATEKKSCKPKERKIDEEKGYLLGCVKAVLENLGALVISVKTETEISFNFKNSEYTLKLTKHRPPKK